MSARRRRNLIDGLLTSSTAPVCIIDADRRIRFCSPGFEQFTGWSADQVEALSCFPATTPSSTSLDLLGATLCPPQTVLDGEIEKTEAVLPGRNETHHRVQLTYVPITDDEESVPRILVLVSPLSGDPVRPPISRTLHAELTALRLEFRKRFVDSSFLGDCPAMRTALDKAELATNGRSGYHVWGPSGSGRRHLARVIHNAGDCAEHSFVELDCRLLLADQVLETLRRLHRLADQPSAIHHHTGTLLLLDADHCPREVQSWILKNHDGEVRQIRLAATTESLLDPASANEWMIPEFCRLFETTQIFLPPLHHRGDDIARLAQHFVESCHRNLDTSAETISSDVLQELRRYRWPGNVRELRDVMTAACENSFSTGLQIDDLPFAFRAGMDAQQLPPTPEHDARPLEEILQHFERDVIRKTLSACNNNKAEAARRLGMTRPRFYRRLQTLGMEEG